MELSPLIKKIGHSLVEIRVRALKSILCKLDLSLLSISDIVQEKMLFVYLLEWFNFPEVPLQEDVLGLLSTLSKNPSAAQMLRDVGAVDFLTQLSPNVEPSLRAVIDGTLDQLFQLPELLPSQIMVYSHGQRTATPTAPTDVPPEDHYPKMGYFHRSLPQDVPPQKIAVHESVRCLKFSVFPWLTLTNTDRHILSSNESSLRSSNPNLVRTTCELLCDVIMQDFPAEIFLQRPNIVQNLLSLLRMGSGTGEASYLHMQALCCLRLLCVGLRRRLRFHQDPSFFSTKQDPVSQNSSFSYSQEVRGTQRSQASSPGAECSPRPSVVGRTGQRARGDGQDGDAASTSGSSHRGGAAVQAPPPQSPADVAQLELPDLGVEDVLELQLQQLTLAQFTVATMEHAIPLLKTENVIKQRRTLQGMVSLTAQPGWSSHCSDLEPVLLCSKYLSGLLEVISSFYVEWGGNSMSFMGKGVTKNAVICLLHLSHEMMVENKDEDFMSQWSLGSEAAADEANTAQLGLAWLIPLWVDRDQEVRFASLGLGAALSSVPSGCQALCASCQNISGGLWGTLLNILLDQQESSMVRREAAFILQNLLVMAMPANAEEAKDSHWQHPCVHDEESGVSLVGLPALQALLYHCQYFQNVALSASKCYQGRYTFHLQPRAGAAGAPRPQESSSLDSESSLWSWRCDPPAPTVDSSRPSSSLSTSSTVIRGSGPHTPKGSSPLSLAEDTPASRLTAQGQSDTDTSDSLTSQDSRQGEPSAVEPVVMVTPDLMTAHCGLLTNLLAILPDFTLTAIRHDQLLRALASLVDIGPMETCLTELKTPNVLPGGREDIKIQFVTQLQFLSSFSKLLGSCVTVSQELIGQMDFLKQLLTTLVAALMLDTKGLDAGTRAALGVCWADVFMLLATLVRRDSSAAYPSVSAALGRRWRTFAGTLSVCVTEKLADSLLHTVALQFLSTIFTEETKSLRVEVTTLNSKPATALSDIVNGPSAGQLCELLLQSFDKRPLQDPLKRLTGRALLTLLACSPTAQHHAAKAGLIDSCVEHMKRTCSQLHLESVRPGKASHRKKEENHLKEVKLTVEILRSALYRNDECKAVATDARLTLALYALWPWLLLDDPTMEAALELLCVYTADCTTACSCVCSGGSGVAPGSKGTPSSSVMHSVMKLASGVAADNSPVQKLAFCLLANLAVSRDCRGVLQKNNFLQAFLSVPLPKAAGVKASSSGCGTGSLLGLWLRLLVSLSSAEDGQQNILRVTGALELLADLAPHRRHALLTLHNLCFCPANKPHVIANEKAMKVFLCCLNSREMETRSMGASALWALLHNNQRAKTTLKCPSVRLRIEEARTISKKDAENKQEPMNSYLLKCLENLSQLLNN
ncbi:LOW QUALITY PROTEIN: rotatin [Cottoperca gobio]|uniref:LOW QUALITY PROTEIN: rotatin n=1 Tax=Cottoperca gobio TaxID=56716 RepID=A0A6J2RXP9_COTGO|nr:LOW QUALITY PROTEIN: rotatin [Cottoperca gobio]